MKLKLIKGYCKDDEVVYNETMNLTILLKKFLLGDNIKNKIVDISCFYGITVEQLIQVVNRIRGGN